MCHIQIGRDEVEDQYVCHIQIGRDEVEDQYVCHIQKRQLLLHYVLMSQCLH